MAPQQTTASGIVTTIDGRKVWVSIADACSTSKETSCDSGCGACGGKTASRIVMVETDKPETFTAGMQITIRFYEMNELLSALAVFGLPLLCTVISLVVWYSIAPAKVESAPSLLSAGASLAAGFFIVKIIDRMIRKKYPSEILPTGATAPRDADE